MMRWWPIFQRNLLVWRKLAIPSMIGNIAEPLMWLLAFGYGLGSLVGDVSLGGEHVPYLVFLASGSICMSAVFRLLAHACAKDLGRHFERAGEA
jgi:lipooligosaccharide transport system permease protein